MIQLPNSGDLWTAPTCTVNEETGLLEMSKREDTVNLDNLPQVAKMSPDVAAMLMADLQRKAEANKSA